MRPRVEVAPPYSVYQIIVDDHVFSWNPRSSGRSTRNAHDLSEGGHFLSLRQVDLILKREQVRTSTGGFFGPSLVYVSPFLCGWK